MTAKTKSKGLVLKQSLLSGGVGLAVSFVASLVSAWIAVKTGDPLSLAESMAAVCVLCGALASSVMGSLTQKNFLGGIYGCVVYTAVCVLVSLCRSETNGSPLMLMGAAVLGGLCGCALTRSRGTNTKKRMKKYVKR